MLLTAYFMLLTPYFMLLTPYFMLLTPYFMLLTPYFMLLTPYFMILTPYFMILTPYFTILTTTNHFLILTQLLTFFSVPPPPFSYVSSAFSFLIGTKSKETSGICTSFRYHQSKADLRPKDTWVYLYCRTLIKEKL
jgi:hypothetical protein